ncbi:MULTISPECIES: metallophosphoesterase [unclassified Sutcliffiella]|uniref:metallophosphoesterase n=1 Tax=unclassified Sutcliffiella TaxID=2837532 RepID=UPI0030CEDFFD
MNFGQIFKIVFVLILLLLIYPVFDNNRIKVVEHTVIIENLPEAQDGFTILQITDLHEKEFGEKQKRLIKEINDIEYDVIVFTGDMLNNSNSQNYSPFYNLIEGIENKEHALFVPGNADPRPYLFTKSGIEVNDFIVGMEERGVVFLDSTYTIRLGNSLVRVVDFESSIISNKRIEAYKASSANGNFSPYVKLQMDKNEENKILNEESSDLLIALNHYPIPDSRMDVLFSDDFYNIRKFDLILAGHYHGGQYRIPFYGALFIPESYYERNGLFPPQDRVKGLWEYKEIKQYVSTGLGSSDTIPFMKFRLFNTPEINVITFTSKK